MKVGFAECTEIFRLKIYLPRKTAKRASSETEFSEHPLIFSGKDDRFFIQIRAIRITLRPDFMKLLFFMVAK